MVEPIPTAKTILAIIGPATAQAALKLGIPTALAAGTVPGTLLMRPKAAARIIW
jgi:hypothetical protein